MDIDDDVEVEQERRLWGKAIFLPRNIRLWHDRVGNNRNNFSKIDSCDETECKFNLNSYKMVFVLDRESYLYKRRALLKARQVIHFLYFKHFRDKLSSPLRVVISWVVPVFYWKSSVRDPLIWINVKFVLTKIIISIGFHLGTYPFIFSVIKFVKQVELNKMK